jgi:hypothetical protein
MLGARILTGCCHLEEQMVVIAKGVGLRTKQPHTYVMRAYASQRFCCFRLRFMESGDSPSAGLGKVLSIVRSARGLARQKWSTTNRKPPWFVGRLSLTPPFLGAFAKLRKAAVSFVMSVRLPVLTHVKKLGTHLTDFYQIWYLILFRKSVNRIRVWLKSVRNKDYCTWSRMLAIICRWIHLRMWNVSDRFV